MVDGFGEVPVEIPGLASDTITDPLLSPFRYNMAPNPKNRMYPDREALALMRKAQELGYPMDNPDFYQHATIWQLDEMITHDRYDC